MIKFVVPDDCFTQEEPEPHPQERESKHANGDDGDGGTAPFIPDTNELKAPTAASKKAGAIDSAITCEISLSES